MAKSDSRFRAFTRTPLFLAGLPVAVVIVSVATRLFMPALHELMTIASFLSCGALLVAAVLYYRRSQPERLRRKRAEQQSVFLADQNPHQTDPERR
jgi:hypothetical protein